MPRSTSLNAKQLAFVNAYMRTRNATQAYMEAYGGTIVNARGHSARLVDNGLVKEEIERRREDLRKEANLQALDVLLVLKDIMHADPGDFMDDRGNVVKLNEVHYRQRRTLEGWKTRKAGRKKETVTEITFCNRLTAIKMVIEHLRLFEDPVTLDALLRAMGPFGVQMADGLAKVRAGEPVLLPAPAQPAPVVIEGNGHASNGHASGNGEVPPSPT